ncbi:hypothetical protein [Hoyosella subflava]|uniref:Uncharacterized protein n=1 Tax=Hoyosella subflava (strain DSM 45089 / JCM 17490 / NBRC 109087 / DQS3-9A1) TaxID=443218 RepID=F6EQE3_HOYSD|nr:hypothetical protein [Hoyosella subflava]AEF40628.1 hypothetical protein AS9A_2179 [Hoyosella subflava DQS3-9A1]
MRTEGRFRLSWAITLAFTIAVLTGLLIFTRDLGVTSDLFKDGVVQAQTLDEITDDALEGVQHLSPATDAINQGLPEVIGVLDSLTRADHMLATLGEQLDTLGATLASADTPLAGTVSAGREAGSQAGAAAEPLGEIAAMLSDANTNAEALGLKLDETLGLTQTIDQKLRIALLLPKLEN